MHLVSTLHYNHNRWRNKIAPLAIFPRMKRGKRAIYAISGHRDSFKPAFYLARMNHKINSMSNHKVSKEPGMVRLGYAPINPDKGATLRPCLNERGFDIRAMFLEFPTASLAHTLRKELSCHPWEERRIRLARIF